MMNLPTDKLSVLLVTYNQAPFVEEAVRSIVAQNINIPFEIVVADDASEDGTRDIISRHLNEVGWSERVRFLDHSRHRGLMRNYERAFAACESDYVAVLEGDDYWLTPHKLARLAAFLDAHQECALCATNILIADAVSGAIEPRVPASSDVTFLGPPDLIAENMPGNFSACFYRLEALRSLPERLFDLIAADWIVNICAARSGPLAFLHEPMSVYRRHPGGAWSGLSPSEQLTWTLKFIPGYDAITGKAYHHDFKKLKVKLQSELHALSSDKPLG